MPKKPAGPRKSLLEYALNASLERTIDPVLGKSGDDLSKIEYNPSLQRQELERCKYDIIYFMSTYIKTYDPRLEDPEKRKCLLVPWPRQVELVNWSIERIAKRQVGAVVKSRDSGVSVIFGCGLGLHKWLFESDFSMSFGSYIEEKVDRLGDMNSLMEKIRFAIRNLPDWMKPSKLNEDKHLMHRRIINPNKQNILVGEVGDQIGRGGRAFIAVVDEASFLEHPEMVESALSATAHVKFYISTPNGLGNWFFQKVNTLPTEQVFQFRWESDPRKDEAWKERILRDEGKLVFEREYNLNFAASVEGIMIPAEWVSAAVDLDLPPSGDMICGLDVAAEGDNENVLTPRQGPKVYPQIVWSGINIVQTAFKAAEECEKLKATHVMYDCVGVGTDVKGMWDTIVGDQDLENKGLPFEPIPVTGGERASETVMWPDGKNSAQKFVNVRAEMWWTMRERFRKTFEHVKYLNGDTINGALHDPDEMISIPNDPVLRAQLSTPLIKYGRNGKIQVESKQDMKSRGVKSPDRADSISYCFYSKLKAREFWFR